MVSQGDDRPVNPDHLPPDVVTIADRFDDDHGWYSADESQDNTNRERLRVFNRVNDLAAELRRVEDRVEKINKETGGMDDDLLESWREYYNAVMTEHQHSEQTLEEVLRESRDDDDINDDEIPPAGMTIEDRRDRGEWVKGWADRQWEEGRPVDYNYSGMGPAIAGVSRRSYRMTPENVDSWQREGHEFLKMSDDGSLSYIAGTRKGRPRREHFVSSASLSTDDEMVNLMDGGITSRRMVELPDASIERRPDVDDEDMDYRSSLPRSGRRGLTGSRGMPSGPVNIHMR